MERIYKRYFESSCNKYTGNAYSEFVMDMNYVGSKALDFIKTFLAYRRRYIIIVDFLEFYGRTVHYIVRNNVIVYS